MAEHLAYIFGTERDRVNCPFYCKIGACRHGNRCGRIHTTPTSSQTLLLKNFYQRPDMLPLGINVLSRPLSLEESQEHFDMFYEDVFEELSKFGEIECLHVCDNTADHMVGNVYVMFRMEEHAENAQQNLCGRYYSGQPINVEFSPVTDFREATCRQYEDNECNRGGNCNFIHLKRISSGFRRQLFGRDHHQLSRARSPYRHPTYEHNSSRSRRHSERDFYHQGHQRRNDRSVSPRRYRRERSRSPDGRGNRSFVREGSAERRAKIERWNREREEAKSVEKEENKNTGRDYHAPNRNVHGRQLPAKDAHGRGS